MGKTESTSARRRYGTVRNFDRIYTEGDFTAMADVVARHRKDRRRFYDLLLSHLSESCRGPLRVLEIGCGTAIDSLIMAERTKCFICGVDLSREALRVAREACRHFAAGIELVNADIQRLPFRDGAFRMVFSQGVLEHFQDTGPVLSEQIRVLAPGGKLVISVPQKFTAYTLAKHHRIRSGVWPWGYETEFSRRELRELGERFGLAEKTVIGYGYWLHPLEPAWVLRSLVMKLLKLPTLARWVLSAKMSRSYDRLWERLEERHGHLFMRDIAVVFEKS